MVYEVTPAGRADPMPGTEPDDDEGPDAVTAAEILAGLANPSTGLADIRDLGRDR